MASISKQMTCSMLHDKSYCTKQHLEQHNLQEAFAGPAPACVRIAGSLRLRSHPRTTPHVPLQY
jgi:hypothetical protein